MILVDVDSVSMSRPNRPLFTDVSVTVASGDRLGVVGINGTGKSTLLSIIAGTRDPEAGEVRRGRGVTVAAVDQVTTLPRGSVHEAVGGDWRGEAALHRLGLAELIDRPTDQLSGGQEKRVSLARALVAEADLLAYFTFNAPANTGAGLLTNSAPSASTILPAQALELVESATVASSVNAAARRLDPWWASWVRSTSGSTGS